MVFSSLLFVFYFLPVVLGLYFLPCVGRASAAHLLLTVTSYIFYGWANPAFIFLMLFSTAVDYICGLVMTKDARDAQGNIQRLTPGGQRTGQQRGDDDFHHHQLGSTRLLQVFQLWHG